MKRYIDKDRILAELKKIIEEAPSRQCSWEEGYYCGLCRAESIIDTCIMIDTYEKKYKGALARCKWLLSNGMISKIAATDMFRELMDNSENIRKEIINIFHSLAEGKIPVDINYADIFTWLDKQGEQKPIFDFKAEDWYVSKVDGKIHNIYHPVDKVGPKFEIGNWVISTLPGIKYPHLITDIRDGYYIFGEEDDRAHIASNDDIFKLWTIYDAENGDVLIDKSGSRECPFIFKETKPSDIKTDMLNPLAVLGYCGIGGAGFTKGSGWGDTANCIYYPASKEQRDLLFTKMREAGYEWDAEKKEPRKIEQKPDFCHHEVDFSDCSEEYRKAYYDGWNNCNQQHAQLKAEQKTAWSDEDERTIKEIDEIIYECPYCESKEEISNWLKSLKQRYTWKPSDEQIGVIEALIENRSFQRRHLVSLYEQLKKLKGE